MLLGHARAGAAFASAARPSGRDSRSPSGTGTPPRASVSETRTWQLARLPSAPRYWRATPTESLPCLGRAVSSTTRTASGPPTSASALSTGVRREGASSQAALATKWGSWSWPRRPSRAAMG